MIFASKPNRGLASEIRSNGTDTHDRECEHTNTYRAELSLANCDFSVWNGVPNVMTEQAGGGRRWECLSRTVSLSAVRPPNSSTSQLIARCFIASVRARITAAGIFSRIARLLSFHATIDTFSTPLGIYLDVFRE